MPYKDLEDQKAYDKSESHRIASRKYYAENKDRYAATKRNKVRNLRKYTTEIKEATPCADCEVTFPHYIMDFDHILERGPKLCNISSQLGMFKTLEDLKIEIAKCDIVCSNCHRHRTWMRRVKSTSTSPEEVEIVR